MAKQWPEVAKALGFSKTGSPSTASNLKSLYLRLIVPFESYLNHPKPKATLNGDEADATSPSDERTQKLRKEEGNQEPEKKKRRTESYLPLTFPAKTYFFLNLFQLTFSFLFFIRSRAGHFLPLLHSPTSPLPTLHSSALVLSLVIYCCLLP